MGVDTHIHILYLLAFALNKLLKVCVLSKPHVYDICFSAVVYFTDLLPLGIFLDYSKKHARIVTVTSGRVLPFHYMVCNS